MLFVPTSSWRVMISLPIVSILLVSNCLATVTAVGSEGFKTGTEVSVTPFNGTHLSIDYKKSVNIEDYSQVKHVWIKFDVSIIIHHNPINWFIPFRKIILKEVAVTVLMSTVLMENLF